jgi:predicted peptidase
MRFPTLCLLGLMTALGCVRAADVPHQTRQVFRFQKSVQQTYEYLQYLPTGYDAANGRKWPLVVFLHGAGERGNELSKVAVHGPPKLVAAGKQFPFILVSPQCPSGQVWNEDALIAFVDSLIRQHAVDTNRVYLTGLSMGGYGTWAVGMRHPDRFAALAPICGGGRSIDAIVRDNRAADLKAMPVWAFHGDQDNVVPLSESKTMVETLVRGGSTRAKLTVYPGVGHDSWTATYNNPEFFTWLLAQTREGRFQPKP